MTHPQMSLDLGGRPSVRVVLDRIRTESRDESEKGRWFEQLFMRLALQQPEFEIDAIWRWPDWPERESLTGLDGRDIGIDLVGRRITGEWVAVQCKCYDHAHILGKGEIDRFLGGSQQPVFTLRWVVATCRWGPNAEKGLSLEPLAKRVIGRVFPCRRRRGERRSAGRMQRSQDGSDRAREAGDTGVHGACLPVMRASAREERWRISFTSRSSLRLFSIHSR